jgi:tetratricopeptide (TPR) repeat protein
MDGPTATPRTSRLCSSLLQALLLATLSFPFSSAAHVGLHEEIETLTSLIQQEPAQSQLYVSRGEAYRLHGSRNSAIKDFSKALDIDPGNVAAATGLSRTYLDQGDSRQAMVHLERALAREPGNVRALTMRAQVYANTGRPLKAAADYTRAIEQSQKQGKPLPDYYLQRARAYAAGGDQYIDMALQGLDESINVLGNVRTLELYAVELETRRSNFDTALDRLDRILVRTARKESLLLQRGDILASAGRTLEATQDYLAAQAAIDALPPQRRNTRLVMQIQADLDTRLASAGNSRGDD